MPCISDKEASRSAASIRIVADSFVRKNDFGKGVEYQVVGEVGQEGGTRYQYEASREKSSQELQERIDLAAKKGYEVRQMRRDAMGITVILERPRKSTPEADEPEMIPEATREKTASPDQP